MEYGKLKSKFQMAFRRGILQRMNKIVERENLELQKDLPDTTNLTLVQKHPDLAPSLSRRNIKEPGLSTQSSAKRLLQGDSFFHNQPPAAHTMLTPSGVKPKILVSEFTGTSA